MGLFGGKSGAIFFACLSARHFSVSGTEVAQVRPCFLNKIACHGVGVEHVSLVEGKDDTGFTIFQFGFIRELWSHVMLLFLEAHR